MSSLAVIKTRANVGIDAPQVLVEVHITNGLPALAIVGLPETAVRESKERVRSALINSGFEFPCRRLTINLAPADLPKEGGRFDLAIAIGILAASNQITSEKLANIEFLGELALTGELRAVIGVLPAAVQVGKIQHHLIIPKDNANEAVLAKQTKTFIADHLKMVCDHLQGELILQECQSQDFPSITLTNLLDFKDVVGQKQAKRAMEIAAAGGHHLLMQGPPGGGKTMLANRLSSILPRLSEQAQLEVAAVCSLLPENQGYTLDRPFRSPHHTISQVGLVGGGSTPRPGEISLAHHGVLFLDELPEFDRRVLEVLRQPMESGEIWISRAKQKVKFPASFQLIAAMNPCPCGYYNDNSGRCHCSMDKIKRYQQRISGPLLDRIDMHLILQKTKLNDMKKTTEKIESSQCIRHRVEIASQRQLERTNKLNVQLVSDEIEKHCALSVDDANLLWKAVDKYQLSFRGYHRILRVARTIADLAMSDSIETSHLSEALSYRQTTVRI